MKLLQTIGKVWKPGKWTHWIVCVKVAGWILGSHPGSAGLGSGLHNWPQSGIRWLLWCINNYHPNPNIRQCILRLGLHPVLPCVRPNLYGVSPHVIGPDFHPLMHCQELLSSPRRREEKQWLAAVSGAKRRCPNPFPCEPEWVKVLPQPHKAGCPHGGRHC